MGIYVCVLCLSGSSLPGSVCVCVCVGHSHTGTELCSNDF